MDTQLLVISYLSDKRVAVLHLLHHTWHTHHQSFIALEAVHLTGILIHIAQGCPWMVYLTIPILDAIRYATHLDQECMACNHHYHALLV